MPRRTRPKKRRQYRGPAPDGTPQNAGKESTKVVYPKAKLKLKRSDTQ